MAVDKCSECGRWIGFFNPRYFEDDSTGVITCGSCHDNRLDEALTDITREYISKYIANRSHDHLEITVLLRYCTAIEQGHYNKIMGDYDLGTCTNDLFIETAKRSIEATKESLGKLTRNSDLSSLDIDRIMAEKKACEIEEDFLDDLEKLYKLIERRIDEREVELNYLDIFPILVEYLTQDFNKGVDAKMAPIYEAVSTKIDKGVSEERVIQEVIKLVKDDGSMDLTTEIDQIINIVRLVLDKFSISYDMENVEELVKKGVEDMELREFEENMGSKKKSALGDFSNLNGRQFEKYLEKLFSLRGHSVITTSTTGDQGADLILKKDGMKTVVQVKKYSGKVSNKSVQEIVGAIKYYKADNGMVITNSTFTNSAIELALANNVRLWDGKKLRDVIKELK